MDISKGNNLVLVQKNTQLSTPFSTLIICVWVRVFRYVYMHACTNNNKLQLGAGVIPNTKILSVVCCLIRFFAWQMVASSFDAGSGRRCPVGQLASRCLWM